VRVISVPRDTRLYPALGLEPPPAASAREYLRGSLPAVYQERPPGSESEAFVLRFLESLERVLDPVVATIDQLPAHLDLALAPPDVIALVGEWLGIELDAALPIGAHRRLLRRATEITRMRGTVYCVWLVLELAFRGLEFEVRDGAEAVFSEDPHASHPAGKRTLTVECPPRLGADDMATVRRIVEEVKPAGVSLEILTREGEPA
jgi:phage tail-like protein